MTRSPGVTDIELCRKFGSREPITHLINSRRTSGRFLGLGRCRHRPDPGVAPGPLRGQVPGPLPGADTSRAICVVALSAESHAAGAALHAMTPRRTPRPTRNSRLITVSFMNQTIRTARPGSGPAGRPASPPPPPDRCPASLKAKGQVSKRQALAWRYAPSKGRPHRAKPDVDVRFDRVGVAPEG